MSTQVEYPNDVSIVDTVRRHPRVSIVSLAVLLVAAAGITVWSALVRADHRYGPVEEGYFGGMYPHDTRNIGFGRNGFISWIDGPPGTQVTRLYSLENSGSRDVTVTDVVGGQDVARVQWSPLHTRPGGLVSGRYVPPRDFPATIAAGSDIRVLITFRKPNCVPGTLASPTLTVHWDSLLGSNTSEISYSRPYDSFYLCKP